MKINILFLLRKNKINARKLCPIECRITLEKKRKSFSTGLFINPLNWNSKKQKAFPANEENDFINTELNLIKNKIHQAFLFLQLNGNSILLDDIIKKFKGETVSHDYGVVEFYQIWLDKQKKLVGVEIRQPTFNKFLYILKDVKSFLLFQYKVKDLKLKELDLGFLLNFEYFLKTEKKHKQITVNKEIQRFKKVMRSAEIAGYINQNLFLHHKPKKVSPKIVFLTQDELKTLSDKIFATQILNVVRDCYLFCCYTGLGYSEMFDLKHDDIIISPDGTAWIHKERIKTGKKLNIPLVLPKAIEIMKKYRSESEYVLPRISNQYFNRVLKEIALILDINKNLTHHTARKTFATTVLLNNDVPIEVVSKLLGHSKISITQEFYAEVMPETLSLKLKTLAESLNTH